MTIKGELTHCFTKNLIGIHFSVTKTPGPRINPPGTLYTKSLPFWCKKSDSHPNTPDENWRECEPKNTALGDDFPFQWGESSGSMLVSGNMPHNKAVTASLLHKITRFKVKKIMFQNIITFSGNICTSCFFNVEQNQKKQWKILKIHNSPKLNWPAGGLNLYWPWMSMVCGLWVLGLAKDWFKKMARWTNSC